MHTRRFAGLKNALSTKVETCSLFLSIGADDVILCHKRTPQSGVNQLAGRVTALRNAGPLVTLTIDCGFPLKSYLLGPQVRTMNLGLGNLVVMKFDANAVHVMTD